MLLCFEMWLMYVCVCLTAGDMAAEKWMVTGGSSVQAVRPPLMQASRSHSSAMNTTVYR
jgi:hypothetical protein